MDDALIRHLMADVLIGQILGLVARFIFDALTTDIYGNKVR